MPERLGDPMHWTKSQRVFVDSMSDLFHPAVPDAFIDRVFATMAICGAQRQRCRAGLRCDHDVVCRGCWMAGEGFDQPIHTFLILTKRPARMADYLNDPETPQRIFDVGNDPAWAITWEEPQDLMLSAGWPLPNVHLGVSVEDQATADERIPLLLETPAALRFVSYEPVLGPVDFAEVNYDERLKHHLRAALGQAAVDDTDWDGCSALDVLNGTWFDGWDSGTDGKRIDWLIAGGESGPRHRPMEIAWLDNAVVQCRAAGVPVWVKQDSGARNEQWGRIPERLRIRELPEGTEARREAAAVR